MKRTEYFGRFIVADPKICHGKLTFKGTRVMVEDVLDMVAQGLTWDFIVEQWNNSVSKDAIGEAVILGKDSLTKTAKAA